MPEVTAEVKRMPAVIVENDAVLKSGVVVGEDGGVGESVVRTATGIEVVDGGLVDVNMCRTQIEQHLLREGRTRRCVLDGLELARRLTNGMRIQRCYDGGFVYRLGRAL